MKEPKRLTPTVEATGISACQPFDLESGELSEDTKTFMEIIFNHERLQVHIVDLAAALAAPEGTYTSATDWKNLAESEVLNPELM